MALVIRPLRLGPLGNNTYVVTDQAARETAVIDVGFEPEAVIELVRSERLQVRWLLGTHAHYDHAAGMLAVQRAVGGEYALHPLERPLLAALTEQGAEFGFPPAEPPEIGHELVDGERIAVGGESLEVIFSPGHSPGHCMFAHGETVFVGDLVFRGSVGRTDLPGGSMRELERSIRERLYPRGDDVVCLTGHDEPTTVGHERRTNPFVRDLAGSR
ncbi:MAG TPA: MBL fold metallo-hydrolase [Candidatus Acidoferrales bacterium]|nr:MBL fold metallo-hydrolase [Candidatus Acidoferrales bacterium]